MTTTEKREEIRRAAEAADGGFDWYSPTRMFTVSNERDMNYAR